MATNNDDWVVQQQQRQLTLQPPQDPELTDEEREEQELQAQGQQPEPAPVQPYQDPALAYAATIADPAQRQAFLNAYMASAAPQPPAAPAPVEIVPPVPAKGAAETELEKAQARLAEIKAKYDADWASGRYSSYQEWNQENLALAQEYDKLKVDVEHVLPRVVQQERALLQQQEQQQKFQQSQQVYLQAPQLAQTLVANLPSWVRQQVSDAEALAYYTANVQQIAAQGEGDLFTDPKRAPQLQTLFNLSVTDLMNQKAAGKLAAPGAPVAPPTLPLNPLAAAQPRTGQLAAPPPPPSAAPFFAQGLTPAPAAPAAQQKPTIPTGYGVRDLTKEL